MALRWSNPLLATKKQWESDPERNGWLLHTYSGFRCVDHGLRNQNVDPKSHWAGAMGTGDRETDKEPPPPAYKWWEWREGQPEPENRWDRLKSIGLYAGTSLRQYGETVALAFAATINGSFNPYYGDKRLYNRAAARP